MTKLEIHAARRTTLQMATLATSAAGIGMLASEACIRAWIPLQHAVTTSAHTPENARAAIEMLPISSTRAIRTCRYLVFMTTVVCRLGKGCCYCQEDCDSKCDSQVDCVFRSHRFRRVRSQICAHAIPFFLICVSRGGLLPHARVQSCKPNVGACTRSRLHRQDRELSQDTPLYRVCSAVEAVVRARQWSVRAVATGLSATPRRAMLFDSLLQHANLPSWNAQGAPRELQDHELQDHTSRKYNLHTAGLRHGPVQPTLSHSGSPRQSQLTANPSRAPCLGAWAVWATRTLCAAATDPRVNQ